MEPVVEQAVRLKPNTTSHFGKNSLYSNIVKIVSAQTLA